jgi:macrolide transport system ATP-binding/permease protein
MLGVGAAQGRLLIAADDVAGGDPRVAVLSHAFWQSRFAGDPGVVGATVRINQTPYTVLGVADQSFDGLRLGNSPALWLPLRAMSELNPLPGGLDTFEERGARWIEGLVARLGEGVGLERARAELRAVSDQLAMEDAEARGPRTVTVDPVSSYIRPLGSEGTIATFVWVLQGVVAFTLLLACANLANLLLARGPSRRRELALRTAIGAGRRRLLRQLLTENLVLAGLGAGVGLFLASMALSAMGGFELPFGFSVAAVNAEVNRRVAACTAMIAFATVIGFGMLPAIQGTRGDLTADLRDVRATTGTRARRLLGGLVGVQVAICFLLLVGAGLFLRTLANQLETDLGFEPEGVAVMELNPAMSGYDDAPAAALTRDLVSSLSGTAGVEAVSAGTRVPVVPSGSGTFVEVEGYTPAPDEEMRVEYNYVAPDYFRTLGLQILRGREFIAEDVPGAQRVVVINQAMADRWWSGRHPIGGVVSFASFGPDGLEGVEYTVVGIADEAPWFGLESEDEPYAYRPLLMDEPDGTTYVIARTDPTRAEALLPLMSDRLRDLDRNVAAVDLFTMPRAISVLLAPERAGAALVSVFAVLALLLACVGIYGVVAYAVEQRRREFGIRIALGAPVAALATLVARGMGVPVILGCLVGFTGALILTPIARSLLVGVEPADPLTMIVALLVLISFAAAATLLPARRAMRTDPIEAMRAE